MNKLKFLIRCLVSAGLIAFVLHKVRWAELAFVLGRLDWSWAIPASSLVFLLILLLAVRWRIFLRQQSIQLPFGTILSLTWAGQFFNSVLPGSTGGDVVKIYQLCRLAHDRKAAAAASVVVDRLSALAALMVLAGVALVFEPAPLRGVRSLAEKSGPYLPWIPVVLLAAGLGSWLFFRFLRSTHWLGRLQRTLAALKNNLTLDREFFAAMLLAFAIHCLSFLIFFLFARSLGIGITYPQALLILPVVLMALMAPVTVNGHGLREVLLIFYFSQMHITLTGSVSAGVRETVVALSVVMVSNDLLWSLPGGLWYFLRFKPKS